VWLLDKITLTGDSTGKKIGTLLSSRWSSAW
jgi:hypothetical protein